MLTDEAKSPGGILIDSAVVHGVHGPARIVGVDTKLSCRLFLQINERTLALVSHDAQVFQHTRATRLGCSPLLGELGRPVHENADIRPQRRRGEKRAHGSAQASRHAFERGNSVFLG